MRKFHLNWIGAGLFALIFALSVFSPLAVKNAGSQDPATLVESGDRLLLQNDFSAAEDAYDAAVAADPQYAIAYGHRCYLHTLQGEYETALTDCQQAVKLAPNTAEVYLYLSRAYDWSGQYEAAAEAGERAIALEPENGLAHSFLGEAYLDLGRLEEGEAEVRRGVELAPDSAEAHRNLAFFYGEIGDVQSQLEELKTALLLEPYVARRHYDLGHAYRRRAQYDQALEYYQQARAIRREVGDRAGEGTTLTNIGVVYIDQGRYAQALEYFQQALAIHREVGNRPLEGTTLNNIGAVYEAQGRYAEALEMYQQALAIHREVGNRAGEGDTLNNIGVVYLAQGRYAEALETYQQALAIHREVGDRAEEGTTLTNIGGIYLAQGRYAEALEMRQQALAIRREVGDRAGEGTTLNNIGAVYEVQGHYAEALEMYQQALAIHREVGNRPLEGTTLNNIGVVYHDQGRYAQALEYFQQALAIHREVGNRPMEGTTLNNIGAVYEAQGRYAEALEMYQQALAIHREVGNRAGEGDTLNNIGVVYLAQGRYAEALETYQQALAIHREVGDRAEEGTTLTNIGGIYLAQGRYAEALEMCQRALAIHREVGDRAEEGTTLRGIGAVYQAQGHYTEALEMYQQALAIHREVGNRAGEGATLTSIGAVYHDQGRYAEALEMCQQALAIHREVGDRAEEGTTLTNIGAVYEAQGRYAEALEAYQQAMGIIEAVRAVAGSEPGRAGFIAQYASLYARATGLFHQQGQDEEAFFASERARARAFLDSLATGQVELTDKEAAALLAREQEAYAGCQAAQDALARARALDPPDPALVADLEAQLAEAEAAYAQALADIEARGDQLAALVPGRSTVLTLPDLQALLDEETTLVSYFVIGDKTLAFIVTHDSFHIVALEVSWEELTTQIRAFRDFPNLDVAHPDSAVTLYGQLIEPLKKNLPSTSSGQNPSTGSGQGTMPHLAIVPHNMLHYLPFAALSDGQRYLVDDYVITYLPSVSTSKFIQDNVGGEPGSPLVLGDPATGDPSLRPLIFIGRGTQAIAALYGVQPLLDKAATESAVRKRASQASILHLAAHGEFNVYDPLDSTLYLAPDDENDGQLKVYEVYGLNLKNADLVVLSACQTLLGHELEAGTPLGVTLADEVVGLSRAFIYAGTPSVISTLWSVDERPTEMLMERFYTYLWEGMGKAEALRQAQLDVRAEYPNPYFWSGFVLSGDPGEMSGYKPPARETATPLPSAEATTVPIEETPKAEEAPTPAKGGGGPCPAGTLILVLGVGGVLITNGRRHYV